MLTLFEPTDRLIGFVVVPEATAVPFTVMLALASLATGFSVIVVLPLGTFIL